MKLYFYLFILIISSCKNKNALTPSKYQKAVLYYLTENALFSDTFSYMVWKIPIDCRAVMVENDDIYFSCNNKISKEKIKNTIALDMSKIEFANCNNGEVCNFGPMNGDITGLHAFKINVLNLKIDSNLKFNCLLKNKKMQISLNEIVNAMDSNKYYNYKKYMILPDNEKWAHNIGALISMPTKDKLVNKIAKEITTSLSTNEEKAQALLDFVTEEVQYSYEDAWYNNEILKHAHEVLLSGIADCSGKSTLYASLLEACQIPYCLLYFKDHVNVGVKGNFSEMNNYNFEIKKEKYYMAETTTPQFKIGFSTLINAEILKEVLMYQLPSKGEKIIDVYNNKPILLFEEKDME